jgi:hypothetical protein
MKRTILALFALVFLFCGFTAADPGVPPVNEVQGLSIETTVIAVGNFNQHSSVAITSSSGQSLTDMPPLADGAVVYESVYTEDTQSSGIGYISYDKSFNVNTAGMISGQSNIESTRQITYLGIDAGSILSTEYLMMGGSGTAQAAAGRVICPFGAGGDIGAFCNRVESGSSFSLSVANVLTQANARFIMKSADQPVELNYNIQVSEYAPGIPSKGSVAAFIRGTTHEGLADDPANLGQAGSFEDRTEIIGDISLFSKQMHYESAWMP